MYPAIYCMLKCLIFKQLLKIANIGKKRYTKSLEIRKIAVPLLSETGTKPDTKKLIGNIDSENASREGKVRFMFVCRLSLCYIKTAKKVYRLYL